MVLVEVGSRPLEHPLLKEKESLNIPFLNVRWIRVEIDGKIEKSDATEAACEMI